MLCARYRWIPTVVVVVFLESGYSQPGRTVHLNSKETNTVLKGRSERDSDEYAVVVIGAVLGLHSSTGFARIHRIHPIPLDEYHTTTIRRNKSGLRPPLGLNCACTSSIHWIGPSGFRVGSHKPVCCNCFDSLTVRDL